MDANNLHLFAGSNSYALEQELRRWREHFTEKYGSENLVTMHGKEASLSDILDAVSSMPFIADRRLVILESIPKIEKEDFALILDGMHPQTVLVIVEAKPDTRFGVVKEIIRTCETKKFQPLAPAALVRWIQSLAQSLGSSISPSVVTELIAVVGTDQWTLEKEIEKLAAFSDGEILRQHIEDLAVPSGSQIVWKLTDLIGSRKSDEAIRFLQYRLERGENAYEMWSIVLTMIKNLALVSAALAAGVRDGSGTGLHPFVVKNLLPLARSMNIASVRSLVSWAAEADIQLKSGGYHFTAEHPDEVIALTERGILQCR